MPHQSHIAIIGDGVGALICFAVLRQAGFPAAAITVYGDRPHPLDHLAGYAHAIRQQRMRSESSGHLLPLDFPGLAMVAAWQQRSLWPLLVSLIDAYNPELDLLIAQSNRLVERCGFLQRKRTARIERIRRSNQLNGSFVLCDISGEICGTARHIILALGHPGLAWPPAVQPEPALPSVTHAYQRWHVQPGDHVVVVGSGMAAVHTWIAALNGGAHVTALHRHPLRRQRLNAPRCAFSTAGIEAYRQMPPAQRVAYLRQTRQATFPRRWGWEWHLYRAQQQGRLATRMVELASVQLGTGTAPRLELQLTDSTGLSADQLICATGFQTDALAHPLIRQMVTDYQIPIGEGMLLPEDDFTLTPLSRPDSCCAVIGSLARWTLPVADTFVGMKYAARRIALKPEGKTCL